MKIVVDSMGGDRGTEEVVKGIKLALEENKQLKIISVGKKDLLEKLFNETDYDKSRVEIINADEVIEMTDEPIFSVKTKKNSSMNIALELVKNGVGDAIVSAGNTGALITASQLKLKRMKGILRPAIATVFPSQKGKIIFMDVGANADTKPEFINQFAIIGSKFSEEILNIENPKVGLLNIGSEEGKGNELTREAYNLLKENKKINFIGNIESREMMLGEAQVIVSDGFTGNMVLKASEGMGKYIFTLLKKEIEKSLLAKIGILFLKKSLLNIKNKVDSSEYGGALFLGLNKIAIKAHGNSDAIGFKNAIKVANEFAENGFIDKLKQIFETENKKSEVAEKC